MAAAHVHFNLSDDEQDPEDSNELSSTSTRGDPAPRGPVLSQRSGKGKQYSRQASESDDESASEDEQASDDEQASEPKALPQGQGLGKTTRDSMQVDVSQDEQESEPEVLDVQLDDSDDDSDASNSDADTSMPQDASLRHPHPVSGINGKGGKGGKAYARKSRGKVRKSDIQRVATKPANRRLAQRAGCKRLSATCHAEGKQILNAFVTNLLRDAIKYTEHGRRKTVVASDIVHALNRQGLKLYGFSK